MQGSSNFDSLSTHFLGYGHYSGIKADTIFICLREFRLGFTSEELHRGEFNFLDHLYELIDNTTDKIALVTYGNGINTSQAGWIDMGNQVANTIDRGVIIMSIHNPTVGVIGDIFRTFLEKFGMEGMNSKALRAFHTSLVDGFQKCAPFAKALHIAHSEGGVIYNRSFENMTKEDQSRMQKYFFCEGIGPAESIPKNYGIYAKNTYSIADYITGWFAKKSDDKYDVEWVNAITPMFERTMYFADHGFAGVTYEHALGKRVAELNQRIGFYAGNTR
jgi:hypothetical protein